MRKLLILAAVAIIAAMNCEESVCPKGGGVCNKVFIQGEPRKRVRRFKNERELEKYLSARWTGEDGRIFMRDCSVEAMTTELPSRGRK